MQQYQHFLRVLALEHNGQPDNTTRVTLTQSRAGNPSNRLPKDLQGKDIDDLCTTGICESNQRYR